MRVQGEWDNWEGCRLHMKVEGKDTNGWTLED